MTSTCSTLADPRLPAATYPGSPEAIPDLTLEAGSYTLRFARSAEDLARIQELRYRVFNLELGEGLDESHLTGRDDDGLDRRLHHLMIAHRSTGNVVGTYRMQTSDMAAGTGGFYSSQEFDLATLPGPVLSESIEIGRACVDRAYRNGRVLHLLWQGLAAYLSWNRRHVLFGCCSLTSQDPAAGWAVHRHLEATGSLHPAVRVEPRPGCRLDPAGPVGPPIKVPALFQAYLNLGAKVLGPPAIDREFKTIDWLVILDVREIDSATYRTFNR
jgi:putative hemolysin